MRRGRGGSRRGAEARGIGGEKEEVSGQRPAVIGEEKEGATSLRQELLSSKVRLKKIMKPRMNANAREWERLWIVDCGLEPKKKSPLHHSWIILIQAVLGASRSKFC